MILINHGCVNKKSFIIKFPIINENLKKHFIRGFFDGDGCITTSQKRNCINFVSGSFEFLESIKNIFTQELNVYDCKITINKPNVYYIQWTRMRDINIIYNYLYNDSKVYLNRKKNKFDSMTKFVDGVNIKSKFKNYKLYIFEGERNIIILGNDLE